MYMTKATLPYWLTTTSVGAIGPAVIADSMDWSIGYLLRPVIDLKCRNGIEH